MRILFSILAASFLAPCALADSNKPKLSGAQIQRMLQEMQRWDEFADYYRAIDERAKELRPRRRDTPLRDLNISDNEVREVEALSKSYLPPTWLNISPVVTDCPCEEGPHCSAQVFVMATTGTKVHGLQLSRAGDRWALGVMQKWWLDREALTSSGNDFQAIYRDGKAKHELYTRFPLCGKLKDLKAPPERRPKGS